MAVRTESFRRLVVPGLFTVLAVAVVEVMGAGAAVAQPIPPEVQQQRDAGVIDGTSGLGTTVGSGLGTGAGAVLGAGAGAAGGCLISGLLTGITIPIVPGAPIQVAPGITIPGIPAVLLPPVDKLVFTPDACATGALSVAGLGAGLGGTVGGPVGGVLGTGTGALVGSGMVMYNHYQAGQPPQPVASSYNR